MFKVKFVGGPLGGTTEDRNFVPRDLLSRSPRGNGAYVRTEMDMDTKSAVMKWEASKGHPCSSCKKQGGFTVVEALIVVVIVGILTALFMSAAKGRTRCVGGYLHSIDYHPNLRQILDDRGAGIKCEAQQ